MPVSGGKTSAVYAFPQRWYKLAAVPREISLASMTE